MQNAQVFPNMVLQMTAIGEESGALDSMLSKVADFYERLGFVGSRGAEGPQRWTWDLDAGLPPVPDWFEILDPDRAPVAGLDEFVPPKN